MTYGLEGRRFLPSLAWIDVDDSHQTTENKQLFIKPLKSDVDLD
ncbi:hypothetical protein AB4851_28610 [Burkholderia sp. 22PA0099]